MKTKIFSLMLVLLSAAIICLPKTIRAQDDMDFEEFMGMLSVSFTDYQLDELSYQLPWNIRVTGYAYGDFSGDGLNDFVIAVKEKDKTPDGTVDVYFLKNLGDTTFTVVQKKNYKFYDVTLEVAFLVQYGECFVTIRDSDNWYFTGYQINDDDSLVQVEKESYPMEKIENAGR